MLINSFALKPVGYFNSSSTPPKDKTTPPEQSLTLSNVPPPPDFKVGSPKGLGRLLPRFVRQWVIDKFVKSMELSHLSAEKAPAIARHELGHALIIYLSGFTQGGLVLINQGTRSNGFAVGNVSLTNKTDYSNRLVALVAGYVFEMKKASKTESPGYILLSAATDINQIRALLKQAQSKGFINSVEPKQLEPVDFKAFDALNEGMVTYRQQNGKSKTLTDGEKKIIQAVATQLNETLSLPVVVAASGKAVELLDAIPTETFDAMIAELLTTRCVEEGKMPTFIDRHLQNSQQDELKTLLQSFQL
jgi:hypothetical protein